MTPATGSAGTKSATNSNRGWGKRTLGIFLVAQPGQEFARGVIF